MFQKVRSSWNFLLLQTSSAIPFPISSDTSASHQQNETQLPASYSPSQPRSFKGTSTSRMSSFYSSPVSPSSDPGTYVSILRNIKRKAINAGARPKDFDAYLRHILLVVNGPLYRGHTESDKTWHIDLYTWEHFCKLITALLSFRLDND